MEFAPAEFDFVCPTIDAQSMPNYKKSADFSQRVQSEASDFLKVRTKLALQSFEFAPKIARNRSVGRADVEGVQQVVTKSLRKSCFVGRVKALRRPAATIPASSASLRRRCGPRRVGAKP
jgi:hypothetical protein